MASPFRSRLKKIINKLGFGMRDKLIILFVLIKVVPLIILALVAWNQSLRLGEVLERHIDETAGKAKNALLLTGEIASSDAARAMNASATEEIERITTDLAKRIADFLYSCDAHILLAASLPPNEANYSALIRALQGKIVRQGVWDIAPDGKSWQPVITPKSSSFAVSSNEENDKNFHYRPPEAFLYENRPLYREITFVDLNGKEGIKVTTSPLMDKSLNDVSTRANTFIKAETYFRHLKELKTGEIYVSEIIGEYVGSRIRGAYTPESVAKAGIPFEPEQSAYAGEENPVGKRFAGIIRWAAPVERNGKIIGYVTLALDHDHIMEFTSHIMPTRQRYTEIPNASKGNYAFLWDFKGRNIAHPRHFSIVGYNAASGDPQIPWLEDRIYEEWQASGLPYAEFIEGLDTFAQQSNNKKPALPLTRQGLMGLDCRYLNFAPQCTGWLDLTRDGGSGSFLRSWNGLWKLNTAAAIPYYTGQYGISRRGFGIVSMSVGVADFHRSVTETQQVLSILISSMGKELNHISRDIHSIINKNLLQTSVSLAVFTSIMVVLVILIAIHMASIFTRSITRLVHGISRFQMGERHFRFNEPPKDEMGALANSFDEMADSLEASVKGPVAIIDMDRNVRYVNGEGLALLGKTQEDVIGHPYAEISLFPYGTDACPITAFDQNREARALFHAPKGRYYRGKASALTDKTGRIISYVINTVDVSQIVAGQEEIERQRAMLDTIFSSSPDLLWLQDGTGHYLAVNPRFATLTGKTPEEIRGLRPDDFFPPALVANDRKASRLAMEKRCSVHTEEKVLFADQHVETLDVVRTPLFNAQKDLVGILGNARNVSLRVRMENELRNTQDKLKNAVMTANKASASKSAFLARMSHEIRTPMNAIIGMTGITKRKLKEDSVSLDEVLAHVRQIEQSSIHLLGLLNDILDISKIEAGKIELSREVFDLRKMVANVVSIIRPRCEEKNIIFNAKVEGLGKNRFVSDPLRLRQVLINLLGNAAKFTPENGRVTCLIQQIERRQGKTHILFSVTDTGIGIASHVLPILFAPFEQGSKNIARNYGGTGLGLSISRSIVQLMGGDITVRSEEDKGSEFFFDLWLKEEKKAVELPDPDDSISTLAKKRILLVDDVPVNRIIIVEQLVSTGLLITEAEDGQDALEKFSASPVNWYDIIFMDVQMPRMDGYDSSRAIRALDRSDAESIPIVGITANAFKEDVEQAMRCGMNAHLTKPLELDKLMEMLMRFLASPAHSPKEPHHE